MTQEEFRDYLANAFEDIMRHSEEASDAVTRLKKSLYPFNDSTIDGAERYEMSEYHTAILNVVKRLKDGLYDIEINASNMFHMVAEESPIGKKQIEAAYELAQIVERKRLGADKPEQTPGSRREYVVELEGLMRDDEIVGGDNPEGIAFVKPVNGGDGREIKVELNPEQFALVASRLLCDSRTFAFTARACGGAKVVKLYDVEDLRSVGDI